MINRGVAEIFYNIADLLEVKGGNPFRIRAYRRAAQNIEGMPADLSKLSEDELMTVPGIGRDLARKIREFAEKGKIKAWEDLKKEVPEGLIEVISVPGLGPKTAKILYNDLRITDLKGLEKAAVAGELKGLPHIGAKTEKNILKGLELIKKGKERMPLGRALPIAEEIVDLLKRNAPVKEISIAGSVRRWKETVKDVDILVTSDYPEQVMDMFVGMKHVSDIIAKGHTKSSVRLSDGIQVDLRVVEEASFGAALQYFTGSREHNIKLREIAVRKGLKINEYGIFDEKSGKLLGGAKESDIYELLGMSFIEPELREDRGEIDAAFKRSLPRLVSLENIRGDLHVHSNWSDGGHSIKEVADEAKRRGYEYIALTDHSKGLSIANGLDEERILRQIREIDRINGGLKDFKILKGIEVDIRSDNTLDISDDVLKKLDIVVASIHSGFRQAREKITYRIVSAMRNPYVNIIAHPTGRLIGERDAYDINMEEIFRTAKQTRTAIEINAFPARLDLNDIYSREAKRLGIPVVISTDTHVSGHYDYMRYGVSVARRAWLRSEEHTSELQSH